MFTYKFIAIQRIDCTKKIVKLSTTANTEKEARKIFNNNYILFFVARIHERELINV